METTKSEYGKFYKTTFLKLKKKNRRERERSGREKCSLKETWRSINKMQSTDLLE